MGQKIFLDSIYQSMRDSAREVPLIGASIVACYAAASLAASCNAEGREGQCKPRAEVSSLNLCRGEACARLAEQGGPANWEIDERQEQLIEQCVTGTCHLFHFITLITVDDKRISMKSRQKCKD